MELGPGQHPTGMGVFRYRSVQAQFGKSRLPTEDTGAGQEISSAGDQQRAVANGEELVHSALKWMVKRKEWLLVYHGL